MKSFELTIEGTAPLLMHAFPRTEIKGLDKKTPEEQAEYSTYRDPLGRLCMPAYNLWRALVDGAKGSKAKGKGKASLRQTVAAAVSVTPEYLDLGTQDYEVDARPVRIRATRGTIMRYRPSVSKWRTTFTLTFDDTLISEAELRNIVSYTGVYVGLGDFRPSTTGNCGRFRVV